MFSKGSSSSTSFAMETPSLVMVGAPNFLSSTTLRPFGPSVTLTVSASLFTPASRARRASSWNFNTFGMVASAHLLTMARTSRLVRINRSSPSTVTSVPPSAEAGGEHQHLVVGGEAQPLRLGRVHDDGTGGGASVADRAVTLR